MKICKFNTLPSTNTYLKENLHLQTQTVVWALHQTQGRGQQGNAWEVEEGKNLTFSVLKHFEDFQSRHHFVLNMSVSLAVLALLEVLGLTEVRIKWPNDILCYNKKICGILVENIVVGGRIQSSVIGVGLNVNQVNFKHLPKATSVLKTTGRVWNLEEVLHLLLKEIQVKFEVLEKQDFTQIFTLYTQHLFRMNKPSTFATPQGGCFAGYIRGVSEQGELLVEVEDNELKKFRLKEISLLY